MYKWFTAVLTTYNIFYLYRFNHLSIFPNMVTMHPTCNRTIEYTCTLCIVIHNFITSYTPPSNHRRLSTFHACPFTWMCKLFLYNMCRYVLITFNVNTGVVTIPHLFVRCLQLCFTTGFANSLYMSIWQSSHTSSSSYL